MQRTRLSTLLDSAGNRFNRWLFNPWRRLSVIVISLLGGNFFGVAAATISGQAAEQDVLTSAILVALAEMINRLYYGRIKRSRSLEQRETELAMPLAYEALNAFKIGVMYALAVEAFKLGS